MLSEFFWKALESFIGECGDFIETFRGDLKTNRAIIYSEEKYSNGAPLESCVGFVDCTKIQMSRPGGIGANKEPATMYLIASIAYYRKL